MRSATPCPGAWSGPAIDTPLDEPVGYPGTPSGCALHVRDLLLPDGRASLRARRLAGQRVRLQGYLAPTLGRQPRQVAFTDRSTAPCQICGGLHDSGPSLQVELGWPTPAPALAPGAVLPHEAVVVVGRLLPCDRRDGESHAVRVVQAHFEALIPPATLRERPAGNRAAKPPHRSARAGRGVRADEAQRHDRHVSRGPAEIILRNARIHTVCETLGSVDAVAIRDGRFLAVGSNEEVNGHAGPNTEIVDLAGRTVVPGLIDSHLHQITLAINLPAVDLLDARSIADVQARIAARTAKTPAGEWIVASSGWHESILAEGRMPTRHELDEAAPNNPVMVPRGGHVVTANSAALAAAGIDRDTPDPAGGVIVRDPANGEATGVLLETAATFVRGVAPRPPPQEVLADQLAEAMQLLNSYGIVCVVDPSIDESIGEVYKRLRDAGRMTVRTDVLFKARDLDETRQGIAYTLAQHSDDMLRFPGIKFMLDGGIEGARMSEPYRLVPGEQPHDDYRGILLAPPGGREELLDAYALVAQAGLQAQTHGVGDEAIDFIAECYETVSLEHDVGALHWCLMHVFLPSQRAIQKLRAAGIRMTVQDHPVLLGHNQRRWWGDERAAAAIPIRGLLDAGLAVGGGTDGPVVPVDPFPVHVVDGDAAHAGQRRTRPRACDHRARGARALHRQQRTHSGRRRRPRQHRAG